MKRLRASDVCACVCQCSAWREDGCNDLCADCWTAWCAPLAHGTPGAHAPKADRSYLGTFGVTGIWTWWIAGQGAGHLLARPFHDVLNCGEPPACPESVKEPHRMVRRPGGWKCYRHDQQVVVMDKYDIPPTPDVPVPVEISRKGGLT